MDCNVDCTLSQFYAITDVFFYDTFTGKPLRTYCICSIMIHQSGPTGGYCEPQQTAIGNHGNYSNYIQPTGRWDSEGISWGVWISTLADTARYGYHTSYIITLYNITWLLLDLLSLSQYKDNLFKYRDSHYRYETVVRPSHIYNENRYTGKMTSLLYNEVVQRSCWGVYWFHSVRPSVRLSVRPASCVRSVAPTVLVGSISYLYILSSNFRRCVECNVFCKISRFEFLAIFKICNFDFVLFWLGIWCESLVWVIMGWQGVSQNAGILVVLVLRQAPGVSW